jgi:uncharacterized protein YdeI (YjbR/CyaY-like superfamily)
MITKALLAIWAFPIIFSSFCWYLQRGESVDGDDSATFVLDGPVTKLDKARPTKPTTRKRKIEPPTEPADPATLPTEHKGRTLLYKATRKDFRAWLSENHTTHKGVWMAFGKRVSASLTPSYEEVVQECLCFGWIDATANKYDDHFSLQLLTPRRKKSNWSQINKKRVEKLLAEGLMQPAGQALIDAAKADGSWSLSDSVERMEVPDDLQEALESRKAVAQWESFSPSSRKMILFWLQQAKRADTREKRIDTISRMAAKGLKATIDKEN